MNIFRINRSTTLMNFTYIIKVEECWSEIVTYSGELVYSYSVIDRMTDHNSYKPSNGRKYYITQPFHDAILKQLENNLRVWL